MGRGWHGRKVMQTLDTLRMMYEGRLICHICKREIIDHRYTGKCCDKPKRLHWLTADHIIPRSRGGNDSIENIKPAHHQCNSSRGARPMNAAAVVEDSTDFFI